MKTTCASVPRTRSASRSTKPGSSCQLSMNASSARPARARRRAARGSRRSRATRNAARARARRRCPRRLRRARSAASAMRGVQCFMPVNTGTSPSSRSSAARVSSVTAFSGDSSSIPSCAVALDEVVDQLGPDRPSAADVAVVRGNVGEPLRRAVRHQHDRRLQTRASTVASCTNSRQPPENGRVCFGWHSVPKVEYMTRPPSGTLENIARLGLDSLPRPKQQSGIEVALNAAVVADLVPAAVEWDPPVEPDHVAARLRHVAEQRRRARAEVDRRHVDGGEDARRVRRDELLVVGRRERTDPRVEHLDHVRTGTRLRAHVARRTRPRASPSARATSRGSRYIIA